MLADDSQEMIWPPSPNLGKNIQVNPHRFQWVLGWIGPVIAGIVGAAVGALLLPAVLLVLIYFTNDAGSPMGFMFAMITAAMIGAGAGFLCGIAAWFIGKAILQRRRRPQ